MSALFSSSEINDMHVQTIFIEDLKTPLASANCYFGLYIETVEDNKEGITLKALFLPNILMLLRDRHCVCDFGRPTIGTFCSCFYTQKS